MIVGNNKLSQATAEYTERLCGLRYSFPTAEMLLVIPFALTNTSKLVELREDFVKSPVAFAFGAANANCLFISITCTSLSQPSCLCKHYAIS